MKYNLGCGFDTKPGWINVDRFAGTGADLLHDLLVVPWPIPDGVADEILLSHVLEELLLAGPASLAVFRELYRIAKPGGTVTVRLQDSSFSGAPLRSVASPKFLEAFDLARAETAIGDGAAATPYGLHLGVDFAVRSVTQFLDEPWLAKLNGGEVDHNGLAEAARSFNNVLRSAEVVMTAQKPFRPGRALREMQALVVRRIGGLGDVLMALSAFRAVKAAADIPIFLETSADYSAFARLCPHVDGVFTHRDAIADHLGARGLETVKVVDWSPVRHGIAHRHEVDAFLQSLGLFPPDRDKGLDIVLPDAPALAAIDARLTTLLAGRRRIVLHPGVSDPNRTWPPGFWLAVARHARAAGHAVITIGRNHGGDGKGVMPLEEPGLLSFADTLDLAGSLHLLRRCDMLISGDAGPIQIAGASDIRIVGLYSTVAGANRLPFRAGSRTHKAVALAPACPFHPCYAGLADDAAVARFGQGEGIAPGDINGLFARWCMNPDRYACTRDLGMLERVKAEIDGLGAGLSRAEEVDRGDEHTPES